MMAMGIMLHCDVLYYMELDRIILYCDVLS